MNSKQQTTISEKNCQNCGVQIPLEESFCGESCRRQYFEDDSCERCECCGTDWEVCFDCGGDGGRDGDDLMEEDPLWYGRDDFETCSTCKGKGGFTICIGDCDEKGEHKSHEHRL